MSRTLIRPSAQRFDAQLLGSVKALTVIAMVIGIFQLGAWYQRNNVAVGHYCTQDMEACWYEVDFTNR